MITIRRAEERGRTELGWLDSRHSFSFGDYVDPAHRGFGPLRVLNEDRVAPGMGFGAHSHHDMEIVSYVLEGALAHRDSLGNGSVVTAGELQRMSAGTGVSHSELNPSATELTHFLQIWIVPETKGRTPSYEQKRFSEAEKRGRPRLVVSRSGREGSISIDRDVDVHAVILARDETARLPLQAGRRVWVQMARGAATIDGHALVCGDGAAIEQVEAIEIVGAAEKTEALLFDLPA
jgi:hypothetical protein